MENIANLNFDSLNTQLTNEETIRRNNSIDIKFHKNLIENGDLEIRRYKSLDKIPKKGPDVLLDFDDVYTSRVKNIFPFIVKINNTDIENNCNKCNNKFSFYCFKCNNHFCTECKSSHIDHSFINFEDIKIDNEDIAKAIIIIKQNISSLYREYFSKNKNIDENLYKNEIIRFAWFILRRFKREKNNFFNIYNFFYIFKLKELIKLDKNNLLKNFFLINGFKIISKNTKYFYEKQKYRWLIKHLISYRKENQKEDQLVKERKKKYNFNSLDILIKDQGFNPQIIDKMKKIINEIKDKEDLKDEIFTFILRAIDLYKLDSSRFAHDLSEILEYLKKDFKNLVKDELGYTEDVKKFIESNKFCYYKDNNKNFCIKNYINDELELYDFFNVKNYDSKFVYLNITNAFVANNDNMEIIKKYIDTDVKKFYRRKDVLKLTHNMEKQKKDTSNRYCIYINFVNIIIANNKNSSYTEIYNNPENYENIWDENFDNNNYNQKKEVYSRIKKKSYITYDNEDSTITSNVSYNYDNISNNYKFGYSRKVGPNKNISLNIPEQTINPFDGYVEVNIRDGKYNTSDNDNYFNYGFGSTNFYSIPSSNNSYFVYDKEEARRIREEEEEERKRRKEEEERRRKEEELKGKLKEKSLSLTNKHCHKLYAVIMYLNNSDVWMVKGWYIIQPNDTFSYSFSGIRNRIVYYNAKCYECDTFWGKGDAYGYIPISPYPAFEHPDSSHIGENKKFTKINLRSSDTSRNLVD